MMRGMGSSALAGKAPGAPGAPGGGGGGGGGGIGGGAGGADAAAGEGDMAMTDLYRCPFDYLTI